MTASDPATPPGPPGPTPALRAIEPRDHAVVLDLNASEPAAVSPLDEDRLMLLLSHTDRADVVDVGGEVAGFVLTFAPGAAYDSLNYHWFSERFGERFYYLDRIIVGTDFRRRRLGGFVYDEIERLAAPYGRLALEVNLVPRNEPSLAFHAARGYEAVGERGDDDHRVVLMTKELPAR